MVSQLAFRCVLFGGARADMVGIMAFLPLNELPALFPHVVEWIIAGHSQLSTTKIYDRSKDRITIEQVERVKLGIGPNSWEAEEGSV
jgi:hypothetical protein